MQARLERIFAVSPTAAFPAIDAYIFLPATYISAFAYAGMKARTIAITTGTIFPFLIVSGAKITQKLTACSAKVDHS